MRVQHILPKAPFFKKASYRKNFEVSPWLPSKIAVSSLIDQTGSRSLKLPDCRSQIHYPVAPNRDYLQRKRLTFLVQCTLYQYSSNSFRMRCSIVEISAKVTRWYQIPCGYIITLAPVWQHPRQPEVDTLTRPCQPSVLINCFKAAFNSGDWWSAHDSLLPWRSLVQTKIWIR